MSPQAPMYCNWLVERPEKNFRYLLNLNDSIMVVAYDTFFFFAKKDILAKTIPKTSQPLLGDYQSTMGLSFP